MDLLIILAAAIIGLVPFNWGVAIFLGHLSDQHPELVTLHSRATNQIVLAICSSIGGVLASAYLRSFHLGPAFVTIALAALILLPSIPGIGWLRLYLSDGFE
jgi:hypothetical protein